MNTLQRTVSLYRTQFELLWRWRPGRWALLKRALDLAAGRPHRLLHHGLAAARPAADRQPGWRPRRPCVLIAALNLLVRPVLIGLVASRSVVAARPAHAALPGLRLLAARAARPGRDRHARASSACCVVSFVFGFLQAGVSALFGLGEDDSYYGTLVRTHGQPPAGHHEDRRARPRHHPARRALARRHEPLGARRARAGRWPAGSATAAHRLGHWDALLPSTTPASQAGILHGNNDGIPNFRWWEKKARRLLVANHPEDATVIEQRISNGEGLLSPGGASISNIFTGDADRAFLVMSTIKVKERGLGQSDAFAWFFVSPYNYLVMGAKYLAEVVKERIQSWRQAARRHGAPHGAPPRLPLSLRACGHERRAPGPGHLAHHPGDVPRHAGHLHGLHRLRRDRPPQRPRAARVARRARRRGPRAAHPQEGGRGRRASLPLRHPRRPRPEPRPDVPAALRRDPPGRRPLAHGRRGLRRGGHGPDRGLGPAEHVPRRGLRDEGRQRLAGPRGHARPQERRAGRARSGRGAVHARRRTVRRGRPRARARRRRRRRPSRPT